MICFFVDAVVVSVERSSSVVRVCMMEWGLRVCVWLSSVAWRLREWRRTGDVACSLRRVGASWSVMGESSSVTCVAGVLCVVLLPLYADVSLCADVLSSLVGDVDSCRRVGDRPRGRSGDGVPMEN